MWTLSCQKMTLQGAKDLTMMSWNCHLIHCSDLNATSMSDLRRHLKSLHFFIERCTVCKNNILDQQTFTALHGKAKCTASGKQPILQALDDSYEALFAKVAEMSYTERNSPPSRITKAGRPTSSNPTTSIPLQHTIEDSVRQAGVDGGHYARDESLFKHAELDQHHSAAMRTSLRFDASPIAWSDLTPFNEETFETVSEVPTNALQFHLIRSKLRDSQAN
ncbi:hypothetical protein IQ06DRAFT_132164 [Phaeosphaeriaceae sp. SRC1lsM3a]|nr:hypothetical protein IQ06DRAFT_132164 [Stagonospora sp. SRC1lsM3a]